MRREINKRLRKCAELVRDGAVLADVGTDHAYLPIFLLEEGKIERAVLSDINKGPLDRAYDNVREANLVDKTELVLTDGAAALEGKGITDYTIAGMGGELIASIIENAPHLKDEGISLVLQPMSRPEALRSYLYENGFSIDMEEYVFDEGKYYVAMRASYTGVYELISSADAHFGKEEFFKQPISPDMLAYMMRAKNALLRIVDGKASGGADSDEEKELIAELEKRLSPKNSDSHALPPHFFK